MIKTLQYENGIVSGIDGLADIHVHGGDDDQNLYMLENIPLYHVNHLGGIFSAFNTEAIRYADFYKSSVPAKYDGRLSSFLDVRTNSGSQEHFNGTLNVGLSSGSIYLNGPIGHRTTYMVAARRSWFDLITIPTLAIINSHNDNTERGFRYSFMDLNAKITHRFSNKLSGFLSLYFGDDQLGTGTKDKLEKPNISIYNTNLHWGNIVVQAGLRQRISSTLNAEYSAAFTRYFSTYKQSEHEQWGTEMETKDSHLFSSTQNNINDWILNGDFYWTGVDNHQLRFGANLNIHSFAPEINERKYEKDKFQNFERDTIRRYHARELNAYAEDEYRINDNVGINGGIHLTLFNIDSQWRFGFGPRLALAYRFNENWAIKGAYARTNQFVIKLRESYLSLPTDQWVPITGEHKMQYADKFSLGGYWAAANGGYGIVIEAYMKYMHNLLTYRDENHFLSFPSTLESRICAGNGTAKGIDLKIEKKSGNLTGQITYSLGWANRTFPYINGGKTYAARTDNRHTINANVNCKINNCLSINASWTGHSGNRITLPIQVWQNPEFGNFSPVTGIPLKTTINNYRLPFYHRLDISGDINLRKGYLTIGLYNAYCHMNTVGVRRSINKEGIPVFQKIKLIPIIPSISNTWHF